MGDFENYNPDDRQVYAHNWDPLEETVEDQIKKWREWKDMILTEIGPYFA